MDIPLFCRHAYRTQHASKSFPIDDKGIKSPQQSVGTVMLCVSFDQSHVVSHSGVESGRVTGIRKISAACIVNVFSFILKPF